jgi:AraC-like DNA-binding protein
MAVTAELNKLGIAAATVELGEAVIPGPLSLQQREALKIALRRLGLELMDDKQSMLIEKIKSIVVQLVHHTHDQLKTNFSVFLSGQLGYNYTYLANVFSGVQGITIEKFLITHKIEKAKELLVYGELTLTEIAFKLHYSSVAHLSNQFKKITGLTPSHFKQLTHKRRTTLEKVGMM